MPQLHRVQLLIEEEQREALAEIAAHERRSVSDVVREVIRLGLEQRRRRQAGWREALDRLNAIRERTAELHERDLLREVRDERLEQWDSLWHDES